MLATLAELIVDESNWLPVALLGSFVATAVWLRRRTRDHGLARAEIGGAMHLLYGGMILVMGVGHSLAITVLAVEGHAFGISLGLLYLIGVALVVPAGWLALHAWRASSAELEEGRTAVVLNAFLAIFLTALGPHNIPLALPAAFNVGHRYLSSPVARWTIVTLAAASYTFLLIGSLLFFASGQSFEEFYGVG